jgi:HlyD family secretion protein
MDPRSVSKESLDSAINAAAVAKANLEVARRQDQLTKAGAWVYDVQNQERQENALNKAYAASNALLAKYTLRAPRDGIVLSINTIVGNYASPQGSYDTYTQGADPIITLGSPPTSLHVRCYVDEILVPRLPAPANIKAQMSIRGADVKIPMTFVRVQPLVSPKIELSDQRQERVDVRVLPVIFKIEKPADVNLYPGELVDVYIGERTK